MIGTSISTSSLLLATCVAEGLSSHGAAGTGLALFLVGLITGVGAAVAAFFAYLHIIRRKDLSRRLEDSEEKEILPEEGDEFSSNSEDAHSGRPLRMPWERPEDWWRYHNDAED